MEVDTRQDMNQNMNDHLPSLDMSRSNLDKKSQDLKILSDGKIMKIQKSRQRRILSCVNCHSKKIKCSRIQPICNNCEKLGIKCTYFVNERISRGGKKTARISDSEFQDNLKQNGKIGKAKQNQNDRVGKDSIKLEFDSFNEKQQTNEKDFNQENFQSMTLPSPPKSQSDSKEASHKKSLSSLIEKASSPTMLSDMSLNYLNLNLFNTQNQLDDDKRNKYLVPSPANLPSSLLQTPIMNSMSNNITNIYFGTNYSNQPVNQSNQPINQSNNQKNHPTNQNQQQSNTTTQPSSQNTSLQNQHLNQQQSVGQSLNQSEDQFAFNLSSFAFTNSEGLTNINLSAINSPSNMIHHSNLTSNLTNVKNNDYYNKNTNNFFDSVPPQSNNQPTLNINGNSNGNVNYNTSMNTSVKDNKTNSNSNNAGITTNTSTNISNNSNANSNDTTKNNNQVNNFNVGHNSGVDSSSPITLFNQNFKSQPNNPGLHNSLNAYSSNPATTMNYLYGTNTDYRNDNLLDDLLKHLPISRERSFELIDRYVNSVHILLPIFINVNEFLKIHEKYWELNSLRQNRTNRTSKSNSSKQIKPSSTHETSSDSASPASSTTSSSNGDADFNYLQFYTLYFPVLYASTISEFEEYDNLLLNQDINKYLKAFNKICQYYNYPHGIKTIALLLGNVIIQSTSPNPSTMEMSQIIRYAKFLQMHKDPVLTLRINNFEVVKFRRLLWWVIFGLDALTSHNFCLPPVCRVEDFNVLMPEVEEPIFDELGLVKEKKLNVSILSMNVKFKFDKILSELVYHLHNGLSANITPSQINHINEMIIELFKDIHRSIKKMNEFYKNYPPQTVAEMNLINFITNHSWSFVDRATMLLHKKILMGDPSKTEYGGNNHYSNKKGSDTMSQKNQNGVLS